MSDSQGFEVFNLEEQTPSSIVDTPQFINGIEFHNLSNDAGFSVRRRIVSFIEREYGLKGFVSDRQYSQSVADLLRSLQTTEIFRRMIVHNSKDKILNIDVVPKSRHFQVFSQNFGASGKVGMSYELGLRNMLGYFETTMFKYEKRIYEGNTLEVKMTFPFFRKRNMGFNISSSISDSLLVDEIKKSEVNFAAGISEQLRNGRDHDFRIELANRQLLFDPRKYENFDYEHSLEPEKSINLAYGFNKVEKDSEGLFHFNGLQSKFQLFVFPLKTKADYKIDLTKINRLWLHKLWPFNGVISDSEKMRQIELESVNSLSFMSTFAPHKGISVFDRQYINRTRGFNNIEANIPFQPIGRSRERIRNQISLVNSLKLNLKHFPMFIGNPIYPFWHLTSYTMMLNSGSNVYMNISGGVGLCYKMQETVGLEILYNFFHWTKPSSGLYTKEDNFQIRVSFND